MKNLHYNLIFRPEPEGGFTIFVPALPGCITYGKTLAQARRMAADAIQAYIESLKKHHEAIPSDNESFVGSIWIGGSVLQKTISATQKGDPHRTSLVHT